MDLGKLVSGIALASFLTSTPSYASRPQKSAELVELPDLSPISPAEERALGAEVLAGLILTQLPHPTTTYM